MRVDGLAVYALAATAGVVGGKLAYKGTEQAIGQTERWQAGTIGLAVGVPGAVGAVAIYGKLWDAQSLTIGKAGGLAAAALGAGLLLGAGLAAFQRYDNLAPK